ncbi:MAG: cyclic pyranopterin monophosphate synthase MoaC [Candidatus Korarchaeota archaeon]
MSIGMIDISGKKEVKRIAMAEGKILLGEESLKLAHSNKTPKGTLDELITVSAVMGVKDASRVIIHAHPIPIEGVDVSYLVEDDGIRVRVTVKTTAKTGVEMDALNGVITALINIFDCYKSVEKDERGNYPFAKIQDVRVVYKEKEPE